MLTSEIGEIYDVLCCDCLPEGEEGWTVNNYLYLGQVAIQPSYDAIGVIKALYEMGLVGSIHIAQSLCVEDVGDNIIAISTLLDGQPLLQLRLADQIR